MRLKKFGSTNLSPLVLKILDAAPMAWTGFLDRFMFAGEKLRNLEI